MDDADAVKGIERSEELDGSLPGELSVKDEIPKRHTPEKGHDKVERRPCAERYVPEVENG